MEWTRSETLALATHSCALCHGLGLRSNDVDDAAQPCNCVLRSVFRACFARFRQCAAKEKFISKVTLDAVHGRDRKAAWGLKDEEYMADFCLVSRRCLTEAEYRIFKYHFLLGADWSLCCRKLKMDRGNFFHSVYRIQNKLGRIYRELEPYALYPVSEYFHGDRKETSPVRYATQNVVPIRPPVRKPQVQTLPQRKVA